MNVNSFRYSRTNLGVRHIADIAKNFIKANNMLVKNSIKFKKVQFSNIFGWIIIGLIIPKQFP